MFALDEPIALWIQIGAIAAWMGIVFLAAEVLRRLQYEAELVRKAVHIGTGNVLLLAWGLHLPLWLCLGASVLFSAIALLSYFIPILPVINDVGRQTHGVFYYAVSIGCLVGWFWSIGLPQYAVVGVLVMAWGDGIAALVGRRWGKRTYYFDGNKRTIEGSLAMFAASFTVTCFVLGLAEGFILSNAIVAFPVAVLAACLEAISPGGTDNLSVPIASAALCYGLSSIL